jgi:hypothetical protein
VAGQAFGVFRGLPRVQGFVPFVRQQGLRERSAQETQGLKRPLMLP